MMRTFSTLTYTQTGILQPVSLEAVAASVPAVTPSPTLAATVDSARACHGSPSMAVMHLPGRHDIARYRECLVSVVSELPGGSQEDEVVCTTQQEDFRGRGFPGSGDKGAHVLTSNPRRAGEIAVSSSSVRWKNGDGSELLPREEAHRGSNAVTEATSFVEHEARRASHIACIPANKKERAGIVAAGGKALGRDDKDGKWLTPKRTEARALSSRGVHDTAQRAGKVVGREKRDGASCAGSDGSGSHFSPVVPTDDDTEEEDEGDVAERGQRDGIVRPGFCGVGQIQSHSPDYGEDVANPYPSQSGCRTKHADVLATSREDRGATPFVTSRPPHNYNDRTSVSARSSDDQRRHGSAYDHAQAGRRVLPPSRTDREKRKSLALAKILMTAETASSTVANAALETGEPRSGWGENRIRPSALDDVGVDGGSL